MTVQYDGNELYTIHIGHQKIQLSKDEITEIQNFDFETMQSFEKSNSELQYEIDEIKEKVENLAENLFSNFENLLKTLDDDIFDEDFFNDRESEIQKIISEMQHI